MSRASAGVVFLHSKYKDLYDEADQIFETGYFRYLTEIDRGEAPDQRIGRRISVTRILGNVTLALGEVFDNTRGRFTPPVCCRLLVVRDRGTRLASTDPDLQDIFGNAYHVTSFQDGNTVGRYEILYEKFVTFDAFLLASGDDQSYMNRSIQLVRFDIRSVFLTQYKDEPPAQVTNGVYLMIFNDFPVGDPNNTEGIYAHYTTRVEFSDQ